MTDQELALAIVRDRYGVAPELERLPGTNSAVFRLRVGEAPKVLKLAPSADAAKLQLELRIFALLAEHGLPAPTVEASDVTGALVGRPFILMASAGDRNVADCIAREDPATPGLFAEMGTLLARIHGITLPSAGRIQHDRIVPRDRAAVLGNLGRTADALVAAGLLTRDEASRLGGMPFPDLDGRALCHGDFHAVQCVVADDHVSAVVDWASAWAGNAEVDLAVALAYLEFYAKPELVSRFLAGYAAVRPLGVDHSRRTLPTQMAHAVVLAGVWLGRRRMPTARRAVGLFRGYAAAWDRL